MKSRSPARPRPTPRAVRARWVVEARVPELIDAAYTQRFLPVPRQQRARPSPTR